MLEPFKIALSDFLHLSKDALHIHLGLLIFLVAAAVTRRSPGSWVPWLVLLAFELVNEGIDLTGELSNRAFGPGSLFASAKDIVNTMLWPTALMLAFRFKWLAHAARPAERGN